MPLPGDLVDTLEGLLCILLKAGDTEAAAQVQEKLHFAEGLVGRARQSQGADRVESGAGGVECKEQ
jgi:hypothetical protein